MKTFVAAGAGLLVGAAFTALPFLILDDDEPADGTHVTEDAPSHTRCAELIPDEAVAALGWAGAAEAVEHVGRCQRRGNQSGQITVATRALGASEGDRSDALADEYDAKCAPLGGAATAGQSPTWLTTGNDACAELPARGLGVAEMFVLLDNDLVQIRIESLKPIDDSGLHDSLNTLVEAADAVYS